MSFTVFNLDEDPERFSLVDTIINQEIPNAHADVKATIAWFADGNPGAARMIAQRSKSCETGADVEVVVGWPIAGGRKETPSELWNRMKPR